MKNNFHLPLLLILVLLLSHCDEDDEVGMMLDAQVDNRSFSADDPSAAIMKQFANGDQVVIQGTTTQDDGRVERISLIFVVPNDAILETGQYAQTGNDCNLNLNCLVGGFSRLRNGQQTNFETEGLVFPGTVEVNLSRSDYRKGGSFTGSFSFNAFDETGNTVLVTGGAFDLPIDE